MSDAEHSEAELNARSESWAGRECPVDGCRQRYLSDDAIARHLDIVHDEHERWVDRRLSHICDRREGKTIVYDPEEEDRWIESTLSVEVGE